MTRRLSACLAALVALALACGPAPHSSSSDGGSDAGSPYLGPVGPTNCGSPPDGGAMDSAATASNALALDLLGPLATAGGNLFFSPYSISSALAMTYAGANGTTATQMAQILHFGSSAATFAPAAGALACRLQADGAGADGGELDIANAVFGQQGMSFEPAFLSLLADDFGAALQPVDFAGAPDAARQAINQWVSHETHGHISGLLKPGTNLSGTKLALADALYFTALWQDMGQPSSPFDPSLTQAAPFHLDAQQSVQAPMMHGDEPLSVPYAKTSSFALLELPFQDQGLAMDLLLPNDGQGLSQLEASLTVATLSSALGQLAPSQVLVSIPKLALDTSLALVPTFQALGLTLPFDSSQADFSGMDGQRDLFIEFIQHEAVLQIDEAGATAAAATVVGMSGTAVVSPPPAFTADHPFLLLIRDVPTGTILFLGQVMDPTKS